MLNAILHTHTHTHTHSILKKITKYKILRGKGCKIFVSKYF